MRRLVFAMEPTKHDLSDAERYGELVYLFGIDDRRPSMWTNAFLEDCMDRMESNGYVPERDFVVAGAPHTPVMLWVTHLVSTYDTVNLLLFDSAREEYMHKMVT